MTRLLLISCLTLGLCLAGVLGIREFAAFRFSALTPTASFARLALSDPPPVPLSVRGQRDLMIACSDALAPATLVLQAPDLVTVVADECAALADRVLGWTPTLSAAHLVQAEAAQARGETAAALAALKRSQATASRTLWLADRRMRQALSLGPVDRVALEPVLRADIDLMFDSDPGIRALARYYVRDADLRPMILAVAETRSAEDQRRFLALTRRLAGGGA